MKRAVVTIALVVVALTASWPAEAMTHCAWPFRSTVRARSPATGRCRALRGVPTPHGTGCSARRPWAPEQASTRAFAGRPLGEDRVHRNRRIHLLGASAARAPRGGQPDVVVGSGIVPQDGFIVRDLPALPGRDVSGDGSERPADHAVRLLPERLPVQPRHPQSTAGLGSYAYHVLGWRRAAVVTNHFPDDWEEAAGFGASSARSAAP